jgi:dipeptidyl aminopeptidase/acylaminoacyl peptidase
VPGPNPESRPADRLRRWLEVPLASGPAPVFDGQSVLYLGTATGLPQVYAVPAGGGASRHLISTVERIAAVHPSPVGPSAIIGLDAGGNEQWQLARLDLSGSGPRSLHMLTSAPDVIHSPGRWRPDGRHYLFSSNARDRRFFDVYEMDTTGDAPAVLRCSADATQAVQDATASRVLIHRANTNLDGDLFLLEEERAHRLTPHTGELTIFDAAFGADGVYAAANPGREFCALVRYRGANGQHEFIQEFPGDVEIVEPAPSGDLLALAVNRDGWSETHLFDPTTREDRVMTSGPKGVIGRIAWFPDSSGFVYDLSSVEGVDIYRRIVATGKERRLTGRPTATPTPTPPPRLGRLRCEDGLVVPYWEYAPASVAARGTILVIHGGPEAQARPTFAPFRGFLVSEGWRVVEPNVRGSLGYGRTYTHLDDVRRRMDSVRDLRDLALELIRRGTATPGRIGVLGGSYGGFMVLAAAATYPELWGAAIDIVGISNFVTFLERTSAWRRPLRESEYGSLATDREFLAEISPLHHAKQIRAPLLVIHGKNDPRVPLLEAEQIVTTLRELGRPVELLVFEDEGHGIVRRDNQVVAWSRADEFLTRHLGAPKTGASG